MSNSTAAYWDVNGVSLQTYAFNIQTLGGDRMAPPPVRGDDVTVPFSPGQVWHPKVADSRTITLAMWVSGADENGNIPNTESSRRSFDRNWRKLRDLFWDPRKQITLGKRFWVPSADLVAANALSLEIQRDGNWSLIYASAKASFKGGLEPQMGGPARAAFTVDLTLADPYFYSNPLTVTFGTQAPNKTKSLTILGDERTHHVSFAYTGPLTSPRMTTTTLSPAPWIEYANVVLDGDTAQVKVKEWSASHTDSLATYPVAGWVRHYGDRFWYWLDPGVNTYTASVAAGTGTVAMTYRAAWF